MANCTEHSQKTSWPKRIAWLIALLLTCALLWTCYASITSMLKEQGAASLRNTIIETSKQCCAIEGAYPESLEYLEANYGLSINKNDYIVTYEVYAENIAPTVVVLVR